MKRLINNLTVIIPMVAVVLCTSSCIYDAPGDKFYRTLWKSAPDQLGEIGITDDNGTIKGELTVSDAY